MQQQAATKNIMITVMNADRFTLSNQNNDIVDLLLPKIIILGSTERSIR
jgi:hypothetical protein